MPEITTDAEAIQYLASMEVECQHTSATLKCCAGSAKVRRFPGLMRECEYPACRPEYGPHPRCEECQGSGLIPIAIPDAVLYLMGQLLAEGYSILIDNEGDNVWASLSDGESPNVEAEAPTIIQALARAIAAAEGEQ